MIRRRRGARSGGTARRVSLLVSAAVLAATVGPSAEDGRPAALASMADAERAFARAAAVRGVRAAFLEYLDDASIAFEPTFGSAKAVWKARPEPANPLATRLTWEPRTGDVSADGRLGWLTGPYVVVPEGDTSKTVYGCYFSIWRRASAEAPWRVYIDQGISTPVACEAPVTFEPYPGSPSPGPLLTRESLVATDRAFAANVKDAGLAGAYATVLDDRARLHRHGRQPLAGSSAIRAYLAAITEPWTFEPLDAATAGSGDLGFSYGRVTHGPGETSRPAYYVRVWRRGPAGEWRLVFDTVS